MATAAQLGVGLFFLFMLMVLKWAISSLAAMNNKFVDDRHPAKLPIAKLAPCTVGAGSPHDLCYAFVYAPNTTNTKAIVDAILADNKAGIAATADHAAGAAGGVRAFADAAAVDTWLVANPNTTLAAVLFRREDEWAADKAAFAYDLQVNTTASCNQLGTLECTRPRADVLLPLQVAVDQAYVRVHGAGAAAAAATIEVTFSNFPHPDLPSNFDVMKIMGPPFLFIAVIFNFIVQAVQIVQEKEARLRQALRQIGMLDSAYWASWFAIMALMDTIMCVLMISFGHAMGFDFFSENAFGLYWPVKVLAEHFVGSNALHCKS